MIGCTSIKDTAETFSASLTGNYMYMVRLLYMELQILFTVSPKNFDSRLGNIIQGSIEGNVWQLTQQLTAFYNIFYNEGYSGNTSI